MPAGSLFGFGFNIRPRLSQEEKRGQEELIEFGIHKAIKKGLEKTVTAFVAPIGFVASLLDEALFSSGPLGEGEERALNAEFARQKQEAIARGEQLGPLASDVSTSDP